MREGEREQMRASVIKLSPSGVQAEVGHIWCVSNRDSSSMGALAVSSGPVGLQTRPALGLRVRVRAVSSGPVWPPDQTSVGFKAPLPIVPQNPAWPP